MKKKRYVQPLFDFLHDYRKHVAELIEQKISAINNSLRTGA